MSMTDVSENWMSTVHPYQTMTAQLGGGGEGKRIKEVEIVK